MQSPDRSNVNGFKALVNYTTTRSPDWTTVRQLDWTPICKALIEQQMRSLDRPYIYTEVLINCLQMQALSYIQQKTPWVKPGPHQILISWTPSPHSNQDSQSFQPGQLSTLIKQPNDQLQHIVADQLDSLRPAVNADKQTWTQTQTQTIQCRAIDVQLGAQSDTERCGRKSLIIQSLIQSH